MKNEYVNFVENIIGKYFVAWTGPQTSPPTIAISNRSFEDASELVVTNTSMEKQVFPMKIEMSGKEIQDFIYDVVDTDLGDVVLVHGDSMDRKFTTL